MRFGRFITVTLLWKVMTVRLERLCTESNQSPEMTSQDHLSKIHPWSALHTEKLRIAMNWLETVSCRRKMSDIVFHVLFLRRNLERKEFSGMLTRMMTFLHTKAHWSLPIYEKVLPCHYCCHSGRSKKITVGVRCWFCGHEKTPQMI